MSAHSAKFNSHGYIAVIALIFAALTAFLMYPREFPMVGNASGNITLPAIKDGSGGGIDDQRQAVFKPCALGVRFNKFIPVGRFQGLDYHNDDPNREFFTEKNDHTTLYKRAYELNGLNYNIYYPTKYGEFDNIEIINGDSGITRFKDHGIIFLVRVNEDGEPIEEFAKNIQGKNVPYYLVDLYQDLSAQPMPGGGPCSKNYVKTLEFPEQNIGGDKKELQLEYFKLTTPVEVYSAHCKPAIYLYPKGKVEFRVRVNTKGFLTFTDPKYPVGGWSGNVYPGGRIEILSPDSGIQSYNYLYYESKIPDELIKKPEKGFTVGYDKLGLLYEYLLPKLGLNNIQTKDFKEYWVKNLPYSPYYFIGIIEQKDINFIEPLEITPEPETNIRVRIYFEARENGESFEEFIKQAANIVTPKWEGYTMVEWGGMVKTDPNHPFTCSQ